VNLRVAVKAALVGALALDVGLAAMTFLAPGLWFDTFHGAMEVDPYALAFLRRCGANWAAFALVQAIALAVADRDPRWLAVVAGVRFSDLFTDLTYVATVPSLTALGWAFLLPPPVLNLGMGILMLAGHRQAAGEGQR
jgi:hypothetical protein